MSALETLVRGARRRSLLVLSCEQAAYVAALLFGGVAVLLLVGTQIFNGRWLVLLVAAGLGMAIYRLRGRVPSHYATAQLVDRRLRLNDTISTAWYLQANPECAQSAIARRQLMQTEAMVDGIDPRAAFPFEWRRPWLVAVALAAVAGGLFVLRYLAQPNLDLTRSLFPVPALSLTHRDEAEATKKSRDNATAQARHDTSSAQLNKMADTQRMAKNLPDVLRKNDVTGWKDPTSEKAAAQQASGSRPVGGAPPPSAA